MILIRLNSFFPSFSPTFYLYVNRLRPPAGTSYAGASEDTPRCFLAADPDFRLLIKKENTLFFLFP